MTPAVDFNFGRAGLLAVSLWLAGSTPAQAVSPPPDAVILEWRAAPTLTQDAAGRWRAAAPGYAADEAGWPYATALVALPPGSDPTLEILDLQETTTAAPGELAAGGPPAAVTLEPAGSVRDVALARVRFNPARPAGDRLRLVAYLRVRVRYHAPRPALPASAAHDPLTAALRASVVNPEAVLESASSPEATAAVADPPLAWVEVEAAGLTALTAQDLAAVGVAVDPARLQLERAGRLVALEWEGDSDAQFEPGERLLFYAAPRFSRYTARDVYALRLADGAGERMVARPALDSAVTAAAPALAATLYESNRLYPAAACRCPAGRDGDRWLWDYLSQPGVPQRDYAFTLASVDPARPAALTVWLQGFTRGAHEVRVSVNGLSLGAALWAGQTGYTATLAVPAGGLTAGVNTLTLALPLVADGLWLDAFEVRAALGAAPAGAAAAFQGAAQAARYTVTLTDTAGLRAYDLTDPDQPERLLAPAVSGGAVTVSDPADSAAPRAYLAAAAGVHAPAAVRAPVPLSGAAGAHYLVITHPDFAAALPPLLNLRQAQGLSVAVEDVRAVYDAADGRPEPEALRAFLTTVYQTWNPRPQYVLLVGDGTYDPRRYRSDSQATFIPPYLADVDPYMAETAADNQYAAVARGAPSPQFVLGRLPVNTLAEAQTVVAKLVQAEIGAAPGTWNNAVAFVADDADLAGDFAAQAEAWSALTAPRLSQRWYFDPAAPLTATRQALVTMWNLGVSAVVYNGHSTPRQWAAERLFHMDDANTLTNAGRLPIVLEMTCLTGSFHDAALSTLDESLLRRAGGGAAGVWGSTGLGVAAGHEILAQAFLQRVYQAGQPNVGAALWAGQLALLADGQHLDLLDTFVWLGDPAANIPLAVEPGWPAYLPFIGR